MILPVRELARAVPIEDDIARRGTRVARPMLPTPTGARTTGGDLHRHRATAALDCARVMPTLAWLDLTNIPTRGTA
jgi:hypothetical protein